MIEADLTWPGVWETAFADADTLILNHAQIGALNEQPFLDNNIKATANVIAQARRCATPLLSTLVHLS